MKDKASVSKAFNKHFFEFLEDILVVFPDNTEIKYAKKSFEYTKSFLLLRTFWANFQN